MHHVHFKKLEASWRGIYYLTEQVAGNNDKRIKLKLISWSWQELSKDLVRAVEFDQSQFFAKIYNAEFGQAGGEPFGLLIGDYYLSHRNTEINGANDLIVLQSIAKAAAAAFAPFITSVAPSLFGINDFAEFDKPFDLERTFQQAEYQQWKRLRQDEDARFVGLVLPQVLMRLPYNQTSSINYPLRFTENVANSRQDYLWGNAAYCFAAVVARSFSRSGWFAEIRGKPANNAGGVVVDLPKYLFPTDASQFAFKYATNICMTDRKEKLLTDFGFITLTYNQYTDLATFYACSSIQKPKKYERHRANQNANLSSMLHYMLCVSRFAHYLKIIARDKIGSFAAAHECEQFLQEWLYHYTADSSDLSDDLKAKYPLREAKVQVYESMGSPGKYLCTIHLCPHYQFDQLETYLQLKAELIRTA